MKAIIIKKYGAPEVLKLQEYPTPEISGDEVLIEVKAAGLNRSDVFQREGNYPSPAGVISEIPGLEVAGTIVKCGPAVVDFTIGDRVCALLAGGGYAEYVSVRQGQCLPIPSGLNFAEAASLPETVFTVWSNVFQRGNLQRGETLLLHGGNSGIGITGIQIAHALGSKVIVTVGSDEKGQKCLELGADSYINYKTQNFETQLQDEGVDVILDMIGGDYLAKNINILKPEGRLVHINAVSGSRVDLDIWKVMTKRLTVTGSTLRSREYEFKKQLAKEIQKNVWPLIESKKFRPVIYKKFPFSEAAEAHRLLEDGSHTGKVILVR
ncbi:NAD(P)H-quinone oxidoreductase [Chryseobacterium rhizosphaerae]|uniref:NAD(P)H-quinone oxidoreductase n=1 Tax=Chryseobacterium rhizosphaerae TaxID=395937 RepID=A0ABX9IGN2_9FLAO|nr:NAD(P)H-quinone oxidoreductase [Chryseobacterium rhizosphaerae]REC72176.1 NAD(P)H-quinone oxidoreductase [Chryseobacterium rhizosphaerae]GEN66154.1 NAD(P)H quinone oxidoreductase [Chryseobacterium rhizosphaerae]